MYPYIQPINISSHTYDICFCVWILYHNSQPISISALVKTIVSNVIKKLLQESTANAPGELLMGVAHEGHA